MNRPKHDVCDFCGRRKHKAAVRYERGFDTFRNEPIPASVRGYCPTCFVGIEAELNAPRIGVTGRKGTILYDTRKRRSGTSS